VNFVLNPILKVFGTLPYKMSKSFNSTSNTSQLEWVVCIKGEFKDSNIKSGVLCVFTDVSLCSNPKQFIFKLIITAVKSIFPMLMRKLLMS